MADNFHFLPDDHAQESDTDAGERLATQEQWAAMSFAPVLLDVSKVGPDWDQARGAIARTTVALLRFDDQALTRHFLAEPEPLRRAIQVHAGLEQEIDYLKTHIEALQMAATRVLCAASRCAEQSPS